MTTIEKSRPGAEIRARLSHPVIDGDGHVQEMAPVMPDFLKQVAGPEILEQFEKQFYSRRRAGSVRTTFWNQPSGPASIDRAMAMLPELRKTRHQDCGIDYAVIYTTLGLGLIGHGDDEFRRACCRALNLMNWELFSGVKAHMTPAAVIPMHTPEEAIAELEFCATELGYKTAMLAGYVRAPIPEIAAAAPEVARHALHLQSLTMDNPVDYDPVWQKCVDLKLSVAGHSGSRGLHDMRGSQTSYVFNHLGSFAAGAEYFCRSLYIGGVSRRFPTLKFAFLEGGVCWAADLFASTVEAWEKRNLESMMTYLDPKKLDIDLIVGLYEEYGHKDYLNPDKFRAYSSPPNSSVDEDVSKIDDWTAMEIEKITDLRDLFVPNFYFGCEADDRLNALAFDTKINPFESRLKAIFGSDIGHWDVLDATHVVPEAYGLVDDGLMTGENFRDFTFTNSVELHTGLNKDFFKGTVIENEAAKAAAAN